MTERGERRLGTVEVYLDRGRRWRWRIRAANGRNTAASGESFRRKDAAVRAARRVTAGTQMDLRVQEEG